MAVVIVNSEMMAGVTYTHRTDSSADWAAVPNSTYFFNIADKLVYYKDSTGTVLEIFSSGGGGGTPAGLNGEVQFNNAGVFGADSNFVWDNVNKRLGIGASPASTVRVDVRAQGALSTDIAFRVRNSADTINLFEVQGNGVVFSRGGGNIATNTAFGENALQSNSGGQNTAFGRNALRDNSTGGSNVAVGRNALLTNLSGGANTAIGLSTLSSNTSGINNTAVGSLALAANTTAIQNTAIGVNAFSNKVEGNNNIALGFNAGRFLSSGLDLIDSSNSIFIGFDARVSANFQSNQIVIGSNGTGLGSNTTVIGNTSTVLFRPHGNVAIGANTAGATLDVRSQSTSVGNLPFRVRNFANNQDIIRTFHNSNGDADVFLGQGAGNVTTGVENTFIGIATGLVNSSGQRNIGVGAYSLLANTTGQLNVSVGYFALGRIAGASNFNTALGNQAGTLISTGGNNTNSNSSVFIGSDARPLANGQTNQIVIGASARGLGSNTAVIGTTATTITKVFGALRLGTLAADPAGAVAGTIYYNTGTNRIRWFNGTTWANL
jgi:hypothetical protein